MDVSQIAVPFFRNALAFIAGKINSNGIWLLLSIHPLRQFEIPQFQPSKQNRIFDLLFYEYLTMGVVVRQSVKSVIITFAGALLGVVVTVLSMRYFPKIEYGFTQNLLKITTQISFLSIFGFNYAVLIQSQRYPQGHPKRNAFLTLCALFPAALSLIISGSLFLFKDLLTSFYKPEDRVMMLKYFTTFPILNLLTVASYWLSGYLQSIQKNALQNLAMEVILRVGYLGIVVAYALDWLGYSNFIYGFLVVYTIPVAYLYLVARKIGHLRFSFKFQFSKEEIKETIRFSGYHMLTAVSSVLIFQLDAILLGPLATGGLQAIAIYSVASLAISLLRNPSRVIAATTIPSFSQHYLAGDLKGLKNLFDRSCVNMQLFAFGIFAFVVLDFDFIGYIAEMVKEGYGIVNGILFILVLGQIADMITGFNYQIISISKYYRFNFWISVVLLVIVFGLNYILIQDYGMYGAACATSVGLIIFNLLKSWFVWRKLKMQPFSKKSLWAFLSAMGALFIAWIIPETGFFYLDFILKNLLLAGIFLICILKLNISEEVNGIIHNLWRKKKLF